MCLCCMFSRWQHLQDSGLVALACDYSGLIQDKANTPVHQRPFLLTRGLRHWLFLVEPLLACWLEYFLSEPSCLNLCYLPCWLKDLYCCWLTGLSPRSWMVFIKQPYGLSVLHCILLPHIHVFFPKGVEDGWANGFCDELCVWRFFVSYWQFSEAEPLLAQSVSALWLWLKPEPRVPGSLKPSLPSEFLAEMFFY